jgi:hypothetical protein
VIEHGIPEGIASLRLATIFRRLLLAPRIASAKTDRLGTGHLNGLSFPLHPTRTPPFNPFLSNREVVRLGKRHRLIGNHERSPPQSQAALVN